MRKLAVLLALSVAGAALLVLSPGGGPTDLEASHKSVRTLDVAVDGATYTLNRVDPGNAGNFEDVGDTFIIYGTIYPGGTLASDDAGNDPTAPGIGTWTCYGTLALNEDFGIVTSTQLFLLNDGNALVTEGFEPDPFISGTTSGPRAVTGGMGRLRGARGDSIQTIIGTNISEYAGIPPTPAVNLRFTFRLKG